VSQLTKLRELLGNPQESDEVLEFYLDNASDIICDIRNSDIVEKKYLTTQIKIAIELFNKRGAEGQVGHSENGIGRTYESADVSPSLLDGITPIVKTPFSKVRVIQ
jgi:hypothetical protein